MRYLLLATALCAASPALAANCADLATLVLPNVTITAATEIAADIGIAIREAPNRVKLPFAVCKVEATARPTTDSEIRLAVLIPAGAAWRGTFVQFGNGGYAGMIPMAAMLGGLARGHAVAGTDGGHVSGDAADAGWALGHPEKIVDFGWRAVKTTTDTAKAIVAAYGGAAQRNYFYGCSAGGREGLMTAQRFPADFDGIVAGAPAYAWTRMMGAVATATATMLQPGRALPPSKLPALQAAALSACGNGRTWIADPRACRFDPGVLACTGAETDACLTAGQLASVRMIYGGAPDATGGSLFPGLMPGAEAGGDGWAAWGVARVPGNEAQAARSGYAWNFYANMVKGDRALDLRAVTAADIIAGDRQWRATINADAADLSAFRAHSGKLIAYHGWNDAAIPPGLTLDYFRRVEQQMGPTDDFLRLFMVPGMLHCNGGNAPVNVDWLALLDVWVETGVAPAAIIAAGGGATQTLAHEQ